MSNAASPLAVVSAPLPLVDRRALSQAWYSALHLAPSDPPSGRLQRAQTLVRGAAGTRVAQTVAPARSAAPFSIPSKSNAGEEGGRRTDVALERRSAPGPLGRKLVSVLAPRIADRARASVVLRAGAGRVQLLIRRDGPVVRVFALCAPSLRENVERALAQARYALAGRNVESC